jgi:transcription elongation GreA/GreB family factor
MWLVQIVARNTEGHGKWHYAPQEDAVHLACGLDNPPWYFRWDGTQWQEAGNTAVVAVRNWCDAEALHAIRSLAREVRCAQCWRAVEQETARRQRAELVASKQAEGKAEVTSCSLVTLRDTAAGEEVKCCFTVDANVGEDVWICSPSSPLGKAILGRFVGDPVTAEVPAGRAEYIILRAELRD